MSREAGVNKSGGRPRCWEQERIAAAILVESDRHSRLMSRLRVAARALRGGTTAHAADILSQDHIPNAALAILDAPVATV